MELAIAASRLRARMCSEADDPGHGVTVSQIAMMRRLFVCGSMTVSQLADAEHVSQQAISQRLDLLAPTGYLSLAADETDRRRKFVTLTVVLYGLPHDRRCARRRVSRRRASGY